MSDEQVQCGNPNHPNGAWHTDAPYPASWQYIETFRQWWRRRKYGCCRPLPDLNYMSEEDLQKLYQAFQATQMWALRQGIQIQFYFDPEQGKS